MARARTFDRCCRCGEFVEISGPAVPICAAHSRLLALPWIAKRWGWLTAWRYVAKRAAARRGWWRKLQSWMYERAQADDEGEALARLVERLRLEQVDSNLAEICEVARLDA